MTNLFERIVPKGISVDWVKKTSAKPTKLALGIIKGQFKILSVYWEGDEYGVWDDENIVSIADLILDLPHD